MKPFIALVAVLALAGCNIERALSVGNAIIIAAVDELNAAGFDPAQMKKEDLAKYRALCDFVVIAPGVFAPEAAALSPQMKLFCDTSVRALSKAED